MVRVIDKIKPVTHVNWRFRDRKESTHIGNAAGKNGMVRVVEEDRNSTTHRI
jgi:hypothetical protein